MQLLSDFGKTPAAVASGTGTAAVVTLSVVGLGLLWWWTR